MVEERVEHVLHTVEPEVTDEAHGDDDQNSDGGAVAHGVMYERHRAIDGSTEQRDPRGHDADVESGRLDFGSAPVRSVSHGCRASSMP